MTVLPKTKPKSMLIMALIAVIFGLVTIYSGGEVIFIDGAGRARAGDYIGYIVWFNFIAGFAYILAAFGLYKSKKWSVILSQIIAIATLIAFAALGFHIFNGGAFEMRTLAAMILRSLVWIAIAFFSAQYMKK